jgi:hypothetical protein
MPYWNEIPGGGGGRPLTDKEVRFVMPLFKVLFGIVLVVGAAATLFLMGVFLWPAFLLIGFVLIRERITRISKRNSTKEKTLDLHSPKQSEFRLSDNQVDDER